MKKNSMIIIFSVIIIGLCGYIIYDKVINKEEPTVCNKCPDCICNDAKDINANQKIKVMYYVSDFGKTNYHDGRVSLALYSEPNSSGLDYGFFSLDIAYGNEFNGVTNGNYDIKDGKLILTFRTSDDVNHTFKNELGVDIEYTDTNDWRLYSTSYNDDVIEIGNIKLYAVK
ncbi:MAG: hypothetical protein IJ565_02385 [Bacilli bacterium]|nr:hypothetical protein [Bacilli bacterium]